MREPAAPLAEDADEDIGEFAGVAASICVDYFLTIEPDEGVLTEIFPLELTIPLPLLPEPYILPISVTYLPFVMLVGLDLPAMLLFDVDAKSCSWLFDIFVSPRLRA